MDLFTTLWLSSVIISFVAIVLGLRRAEDLTVSRVIQTLILCSLPIFNVAIALVVLSDILTKCCANFLNTVVIKRKR